MELSLRAQGAGFLVFGIRVKGICFRTGVTVP